MNIFIKVCTIVNNKIKNKLQFIFMKKKWRDQNSKNKTSPMNYFPIELVKVGDYSYGPLNVRYWETEKEGLEIGNFVSIAEGVKFILGGNHEVNTFTTYPFRVMILEEKVEAWTKGPILIKDDVWIGMDSLILSGVTIGQGAIVAAGSIVTKDVPPYSIVGGNPAKLIKHRYSKEIIDEMITFDWSKVNLDKVEKLREELYRPLTLELAKKIKVNFPRGLNDKL
ncbi:MAG: CatB-related O-acetyltransferase [Fusobacteriaceae bacterium]